MKNFINNIVDYKDEKEPKIDINFCEQFFQEFITKNPMKQTFDFISDQIERNIKQSFEVFHQDQKNINLLCSIFGSNINFYHETENGINSYKPDKEFIPSNNISFGILITFDSQILFLSKGDKSDIQQNQMKLNENLQLYLQNLSEIEQLVEQLNILNENLETKDLLNHPSEIITNNENDRIRTINCIDKILERITSLPIKLDELRNRIPILKEKMFKYKKVDDNLNKGKFKEKDTLIEKMFFENYTYKKCILCNKLVLMMNIYSNCCGHTYCKQCISEEVIEFMIKLQSNKSPILFKCPFPDCYSLLSGEIINECLKNTKMESFYKNYLEKISSFRNQLNQCMFCGLNESDSQLIESHSKHYL